MTSSVAAGLVIVLPDTNKPAVTLKYPLVNARLTNGVTYTNAGVTAVAPNFVFSGLATDNGLVTNVFLKKIYPTVDAPINATLYGALAGSKTWTNLLTLVNGTNTYQVWAADYADNLSVTSTISFFFVNQSTLTVTTNGYGSTTNVGVTTYGKATNGALLEVGRNYQISALPMPNNIFSNWLMVDAISTNIASTNLLTFRMSQGLSLTAIFVTNPVLTVTGSYNGLFYQTNLADLPAVTVPTAGFLGNVVVTTNRVFSGSLSMLGSSYGFAGTFDLSGNAVVNVPRSLTRYTPASSTLTLNLHLDWATGSKEITGTVVDSVNGWSAPLVADLAVYNAGHPYPTPGRATIIIPYAPGSPFSSPGGYSYLSVTNNTNGLATWSGKLADGTAVSGAVPISQDGNWPLYANLYLGRGILQGWLNITNGTQAGAVSWVRQNFAPGVYTNGFTNLVSASGLSYTNPGVNHAVLSQTNLTLRIGDADLTPTPLTWHLGLKTNNNTFVVLSGSAANLLNGSINPVDGTVTVNFVPTGRSTYTPVFGAVQQGTTNAFGFFVGATNSGSLWLHSYP